MADALTRIIKRRRGYPRQRLVWAFAGYDARLARYGPARIDTVDENGTVLATQPLAERMTEGRATITAMSRGLDIDIDGRVHQRA